jgi:hypothetical protein
MWQLCSHLIIEPNKPVSVTVDQQTTNSIKISWTKPDGGVNRYKTILTGATAEDNGLNTMKTFTDLTAGTEYTIKVYAEAGTDTASEYVTNMYYTGDLLSSVF